MRPYETLFVVHPDHMGRVKEFIERFGEIIERMAGSVSHVDEWGLRDLAYRIQKQSKGYYVILQYRSTAAVVEELERNMKIMDGVMRYLTVRLDDDAAAQKKATPQPTRKASGEGSLKPESPA